MSTQEIQKLDDKLDNILFDMEGIKGDVEKIVGLLKGNPLDKDDAGLVGRQNKLDKRVSSLEKWKDRAVWGALGLGIGSGVGLVKFLEYLIK